MAVGVATSHWPSQSSVAQPSSVTYRGHNSPEPHSPSQQQLQSPRSTWVKGEAGGRRGCSEVVWGSGVCISKKGEKKKTHNHRGLRGPRTHLQGNHAPLSRKPEVKTPLEKLGSAHVRNQGTKGVGQGRPLPCLFLAVVYVNCPGGIMTPTTTLAVHLQPPPTTTTTLSVSVQVPI